MRRKSDWLARLARAIDARAGRAFAWGSFDCCMAACDLVEAQTGTDPGKALRRYTTLRGAAMVLGARARGVPAAQRLAAVAAMLGRDAGMPEIEPAYAQRGDIVVIPAPTEKGIEDALGIVDLSGRFVLTAARDGGWARLPAANAVRAWKVG